MPAIAFAIPVMPGKEGLDRETFSEMESSRREEYEAALRDAGIRRHTVWHQQTPDGTTAVVYMEVDDEAGLARFTSSDAPLNRWFREQMREVHGIDIAQSAPQLTKLHDMEA